MGSALATPQFISAFVSITADVGLVAVILWRTRGVLNDCPTPVYCLVFFAVADVVRCAPFCFPDVSTDDSGSGNAARPSAGCVAQAFCLWFGIEATTLWMMAFAHAVWARSVTLKPHQSHEVKGVARICCRRRAQQVYHALCWVFASCTATVLAALDLFGTRENGEGNGIQYCTITKSNIATIFLLPTQIALVFNTTCLAHAQWHIGRVRARAALLIDADAAARAAQGTRKVRLDFGLYIAVFVLSQTPIAVFDFLSSDVDFPRWVGEALSVLTLLHGALNVTVFGATLPWMRAAGDEARPPDGFEVTSLQLASTVVPTGRISSPREL